jgi:hypothetical protein
MLCGELGQLKDGLIVIVISQGVYELPTIDKDSTELGDN